MKPGVSNLILYIEGNNSKAEALIAAFRRQKEKDFSKPEVNAKMELVEETVDILKPEYRRVPFRAEEEVTEEAADIRKFDFHGMAILAVVKNGDPEWPLIPPPLPGLNTYLLGRLNTFDKTVKIFDAGVNRLTLIKK